MFHFIFLRCFLAKKEEFGRVCRRAPQLKLDLLRVPQNLLRIDFTLPFTRNGIQMPHHQRSRTVTPCRRGWGNAKPSTSVHRRSSNSGLSYNALEARNLLATFMVTTAIDSNADVMDGVISLREALIAANTNAAFGDAPAGDANGDMIRFHESVYNKTMTLDLGQIEISDDVLIQGGISNVIISGNEATRLFSVSASERVGFSKLTFTGGSADFGGAMIINGSGSTILSETTFTNNSSSYAGGAIYYANGNMFISDTSFSENRSVLGGAFYQRSGNAHFTDSLMESNEAIYRGSGGAIATVGGFTHSVNLTLTGNSAGNSEILEGSQGGGIYVAGDAIVSIRGGEFSDNVAGQQGGGIWLGDSGQVFAQAGALITGNSASHGGGFYNSSAKLYINGLTVRSNSARLEGGGIFSENGQAVISNSAIDRNSSGFAGGGIHVSQQHLQLTNSALTNNDAGITIEGHRYQTDSDGDSADGIEWQQFGGGGGVYIADQATVVIENGQVDSNRAKYLGGGIYHSAAKYSKGSVGVHSSANSLFLRNGTRVGFNIAQDGGGIMGDVKTFLQAIDAVFEGNLANGGESDRGRGGGLMISGKARIDGTTFSGNAAHEGRGISLRGSQEVSDSRGSLYLTNSEFASSGTTDEGAAIYVGREGDLHEMDVDFPENTSDNILYTLEVSATEIWMNTGVILDPGQQMTITYVSGQWTANPGTGLTDADGNSRYRAKPGYTLPGKREGALIGWVIAQGEEEGNVGSSNDPFLVGSAGTVPAGQGGQLFLSINDDLSSAYGSGFADNLGFIVVNVSMQEVI